MRFLQGIASGTMIPVLMMAALKFLPPHIRLHGLALYALTATFAPKLSIWLAGHWTDGLFDWRWVYWQILPLAAIAALLIGWGLPNDPIQTDRRSDEPPSEHQSLMRTSYAVFSLQKQTDYNTSMSTSCTEYYP